jgi:hypothetical protein
MMKSRRAEEKTMKVARLLIAMLICATAVAVDTSRGTVPKAAADQYPAHTAQDGVNIGAALLGPNDVRHAFSTQINECCTVVEIAIYPQKNGLVEVSLNDFALRVVGQDIAAKPSSAEVVAGKLYRQTQPEPNTRDVTVSPVGGIGYESGGIDPVTGQRRPGGVVTSAGVGVGVGSPSPKPGSTEADRRTMQLELREKGLPEGNTALPVAGYVYFTIAPKKKTKYQFEYMLNGNKVVLPL